MPGSDDPQAVPRKVSEALLYQLKQRAMKACAPSAEAYARCCTGRSFSMVWACRGELRALSDCLGTHTNDTVLSELKRRWLAAGRPESPDWAALLDGL